MAAPGNSARSLALVGAKGHAPRPQRRRFTAPRFRLISTLGGVGVMTQPGARGGDVGGADRAAPNDALTLFASHGASAGDDKRLINVLVDSADETTRRLDELRIASNSIGAALLRRREADVLEIAQWFRVVISFLWGGAAAFVLWPHLVAKFNDTLAPLSAVPKDDAWALARMFGVLFLLGVLAAYLPLILAIMRGRFSPRGVIDRSQEYGRRLAGMLRGLDDRLRAHRAALGDSHKSNAEVATEVARAHVTAQSAILLFHELGFIVDEESAGRPVPFDAALKRYRGYLSRSSAPAENTLYQEYLSGLARGGLAGLAFGAAFGAVGVLIAMGIPLEIPLVEIFGGIEDYPAALALLIFGGLSYFFLAEPLAEIVAELGYAATRQERIAESLRAIRSTITGDQAPRARDIAQRVEDLAEIFRSRLSGGSTSAHHQAEERTDLPWRQAPEAPRFALQSFDAAPPIFRVDRQAPGEKKMFSGRRRNAAPKQSAKAPEAPPWLKD